MDIKTNYPSVDFLYLSEKDCIAAGVENMKDCIDTMDELFSLVEKGDYRMGGSNGNEHGIKMAFPKETDIPGMPVNKPDYRFMAMPAYVGGDFHLAGVKCYGSNQDNRGLGLPRSVLMLTLQDATTGAPLAYMSANLISSMRTGAVPGLGVRYCTNSNPKVCSIIGPGVMGRTAILAINAEKPEITTVKIKGRSQRGIDDFIEFTKAHCPSITEFIQCDSIEEACSDSDIIYFGTTNAPVFEDNPRVKKEWLKKGALVISTSALLVDTDFVSSPDVKLVDDAYLMYEGWGKGVPAPTQKNISTLLGMGFYDAVVEGKITADQIIDIGKIINGKATGRDNDDQIVLYAVGGMPIEDVAWGYKILKNAYAKGIGTKLNLWDTPEWK